MEPSIRVKEIRLTSTSYWNARGMVANYQRALVIGDTNCIKLFESAYPDQDKRFFRAIEFNEIKIEDDEVVVYVPITPLHIVA